MIIRSLRNIAEKYRSNNSMLDVISNDETPHMMFETKGNGLVKISDDFPKRIVLNAKLISLQNFSNAKCERKIDGKTVSCFGMYSNVESKYCSSINVVFENNGYAIGFDNDKVQFSGKDFDNYQIVIDNNILFKKNFLIMKTTISETINNGGIVMKNGQIASRIIYPYGGVCQYGLHPKLMEASVCFLNDNNELKVVELSSVQNVDPTKNTLMKSGKWFVGIHDFDSEYRTSLYDDIMNGSCKFVLRHNEFEKNFVSNSLNWIEKTNLLQIGFE